MLARRGAADGARAGGAVPRGSECLDPACRPPAATWNDRRIQALEGVDAAAAPAIRPAIPAYWARARLRHAEALAGARSTEARRAGAGDGVAARRGGAIRELALVDRGVLAPEDLDTYDDVAVRVAASRWATERPLSAARAARRFTVAPRGDGESCVRVGGTSKGAKARVLAERCTYGVVWSASLRWSPAGNVATMAVQPLPAWTELWVIRRGVAPANDVTAADAPANAADGGAWSIEPLVAATVEPEAGYVEAAGFSPDGAHLLVVREARGVGHPPRRFQVLSVATLAVEKQAGSADKLLSFKRWSAAWWRAGTLALRWLRAIYLSQGLPPP